MANHTNIILLHGILRTDKSMSSIAKALGQQGFNVLNIRYPSRQKTFYDIVDFIHQEIKKNNLEKANLSFISHSMGSLLTRAYIQKYKPTANKVIMLSPPNNGSKLATIFKNWYFYKKLFGKAGQILHENSHIIKSLPKNIPCTTGIIAGTLPLNPITPLLLKSRNDGVVTIESMKSIQYNDLIELKVNHNYMVYNSSVIRQVINFMNHSKFYH